MMDVSEGRSDSDPGKGHSGRLRSCDRPGHHQYPVHDLRSRRCRGGAPSARASADPAQGRVGGTQPGRDLGAHLRGDHDRAEQAPTWCPRTLPHWASPTSGRPRWSGTATPAGLYHNAIVWQDTRTDRIAAALDRDGRGDVIRRKAGLPPATYFSGGKIQWILDNVEGVRRDAENGDAIFGTSDTLGDLEPHRWLPRRRARHRRHQRQPHHVDEPGDAGLGRRTVVVLLHSAADDARDQAVVIPAPRSGSPATTARWPGRCR